MTDAPGVPAAAAAPSAPWTGSVIAALVLAITLTVALLALKTLAALWAFPQNGEDYSLPATALGVVLGLGIVPDILLVVFGHLALAQTRDGRRGGRVIAAISLGVGYMHVLLWVNRLVNAAVAATGFGSFTEFVPNLFWWA
ncbi:MAG: DUF4190 domain-containing protein [Pseudolysinimonas sp.]